MRCHLPLFTLNLWTMVSVWLLESNFIKSKEFMKLWSHFLLGMALLVNFTGVLCAVSPDHRNCSAGQMSCQMHAHNGHDHASANHKNGAPTSKHGDPMGPLACIVSCSIHSVSVNPQPIASLNSPTVGVSYDAHSILAFVPNAPVEDIFHPPA
jgi:hypothetical protein